LGKRAHGFSLIVFIATRQYFAGSKLTLALSLEGGSVKPKSPAPTPIAVLNQLFRRR
jgi:hypothetical protein